MSKENKAINVAITNEQAAPGMPLLSLSLNDKFYLATARTNDETLHYVYSMFCRQRQSGTYEMMPETDIAAFADAKVADVYYKTIENAVAYNKRGRMFEAIQGFVGNYIEDFYMRIR
jgi:hypothetical protein